MTLNISGFNSPIRLNGENIKPYEENLSAVYKKKFILASRQAPPQNGPIDQSNSVSGTRNCLSNRWQTRLRAKTNQENKVGHFTVNKETTNQNVFFALNKYGPNSCVHKIVRSMLLELKTQININLLIVGGFCVILSQNNCPFEQKKIRIEKSELNDIILNEFNRNQQNI